MRTRRFFILALLASLLLVSVTSAAGTYVRPKVYSGYNSEPYLNVSTGFAQNGVGTDLEPAIGTFNTSTWMATTVGKVTETMWMPTELFMISLTIWFVAIIISTRFPESEMVAATIALLFMGWIYMNMPMLSYHGVSSSAIIYTYGSTENYMMQIQPWQELFLLNNGYVYIFTALFWMSVLNWFVSAYHLVATITKKERVTMVPKDDRLA